MLILRRLVLPAAVAAVSIAFGPAALAADRPSPGPVGLGVSVAADPIPAEPGHQVPLALRISNPSGTPVSVEIAQRALALGDNGRMTILDHPDPKWAPYIRMPNAPVMIPAQGFRDLSMPLDVPLVAPDSYLIGFLVTPTATGVGVHVLTSAGAYVAIDVPGPRDRRLSAHLVAPGVVWGRLARAKLAVVNVGASSTWFWGEDATQRLPKTFLPAGRQRSVPLSIRARLGLGVEHVRARIFYHRSDAQVIEIDTRHTVVFIDPPYGAGAVLLVGAVVGLGVRRRVRKCRRSASRRSNGRRGASDTRGTRRVVRWPWPAAAVGAHSARGRR